MKCGPNDCVGPEDFAFWVTCWNKDCSDPACILVPDDICDGGLAASRGLPPLPSDAVLRSHGLEPPAADWKGYGRGGILRAWESLEDEHTTTRRTPATRSRQPGLGKR